MRIRIFDDLHGKEIYGALKVMLPGYTYPIKKDIRDPLPYLKKIKNGDLILLDNYFNGWDLPLGDRFLKEFMNTNLDCRIIAISDFGVKLVDMFKYWKLANEKGIIVGWVKSKKGLDIGNFLNEYLG